MKKRRKNINSAVGIASLVMSVISVVSIIWLGAVEFSSVKHDIHDMKGDIQDLKADVRKINDRLDKMDQEFHKMDIRVNILEHQKH
jgi:hypothetical protein